LGTKGETLETAKGEPKASRAGGVGDGKSVEGRQLAKGNTVEQNAPRTQSRTHASSALDRVREVARKDKKARFTALLHQVTVERLRAAFFQLKRKAAAGVDGGLDALVVGILRKKVNWVLDADIQRFFDTIDHEWLMQFLEHRIADRRVLRLIRKWLKAGVMEDEQ